MIAQYRYEIKFRNEQGELVGQPLPFSTYLQCMEMYESLDTINAHLIPADATGAEWHMIEVAVTASQPRRSMVSGRYKGGAY